MPLAHGDGAVVTAARDTDGAAFLLASATLIGKSRRHRDVINLRRGLVVPGTPGGSAVHGYERALIADEKDNVGIVGVDPKILVIVATRCAAKSGPGLAAVCGSHGHSARAVNDVWIFGIDAGNREVSATNS